MSNGDIDLIYKCTDEYLAGIINEWIEEMVKHKRYSENTVKAYIKDARNFFEFLKNHESKIISMDDLKSLETRHFRSWLSCKLNSGNNHRSNSRAVSAVKSLIDFISIKYSVCINSINALKRPKLPQLLPRPVTIDIIFSILDLKSFNNKEPAWVTLRDKALYMILYGAGLRIQEALNLKVKDVGKFLNIIGKGKKQRVTPLLENVRSVIHNHISMCPFINENDPECILFWGERGKKLRATTIEHRLEKVRIENNLPDYFTPHALRHSFASHLMQSGVDMRYVQELLGHSSLSSTQIYTDINNEQMLDIYEKSHPLELS